MTFCLSLHVSNRNINIYELVTNDFVSHSVNLGMSYISPHSGFITLNRHIFCQIKSSGKKLNFKVYYSKGEIQEILSILLRK